MAVKGSNGLKAVIDGGGCVACGACLNLCPYIKRIEDRVVIIHPCGLDQGRCYDFCPNTPIETPLKGREIEEAMIAQSADPQIRSHAQYGGVVSSLLIDALEMKMIDAVVLSTSDDTIGAYPIIARTKDEILSCASTRYVASCAVSGLNIALKEGYERIGFVGTPCQVKAAQKMKAALCEGHERIKLIIGLFCMWALDYRKLSAYLEEKIKSDILRLDIPLDGFVVVTEDETLKLPLEEIKMFIRSGCEFCQDMTSEFADISVGAVEGVDDWNTVIIRNEVGNNLFNHAVDASKLKSGVLDEDRLTHLKEASENKKRRAKKWVI